MSNLDDYRAEIDDIDKQLTALFEKRMNVVLKVAEYKKEKNLPVLQSNREEQVLNKAVNNLQNKDYTKEIKDFFNGMMHISKGYEHRKIAEAKSKDELSVKRKKIKFNEKAGFSGVKGSFSEQALLKFFGEDVQYIAYEQFEDVFAAINFGEIKYGIVPIENSSSGAIAEVYDLLRKYGFYIVGEECIKVKQNLIGIKNTSLEDIKEVYSHPQGFLQCSEFLKPHKEWKKIPFNNTATSAKLVRDIGDKSKAAIASERAAKVFGLDIIKEAINNEKENHTRFIVISKEMQVNENADKVSVVFSLEHKVGTLYKLLRYFAENKINMIKIESRPMKDTSWRYFLYVDFLGKIDSEDAKRALSYIKSESAYFKILGAYENKLS